MPAENAKNTSSDSSRRGTDRWRRIIVVGLLAAAGAVWIAQRGGAPAGQQLSSPAHPISVFPDLPRVDHLPIRPGALAGWNVLLVTLDTTRADHLGCYGNPHAQTPTLDGLARQGVTFADAVAVAPSTLPAHASLLTGQYPYRHRARTNGQGQLASDCITLAEVLTGAGYATAAVVSAVVLESRFGLSRGFQLYDDDFSDGQETASHRAAAATNVRALRWLRRHGRERFFLWVHYYDPHYPYTPPPIYHTRFAEDPYAGEIAYMDGVLGALIGALDRIGVRERTLIVVVGDHGEGLGQHHQLQHIALLYESTMRIPLIFHAPGVPGPPAVVDRLARQVDVMPTILDLLGLPAVPGSEGRSLLFAAPASGNVVYLESVEGSSFYGWAPMFGVRTGRYKYVWAPREELYDLQHDPQELHNLVDERPDLVSGMRAQLESYYGRNLAQAAAGGTATTTDPPLLARLGALGYLGSTAEPVVATDDAPDPKDMIQPYEQAVLAIAGYRVDGNLPRAVSRLSTLIAADPRTRYYLREHLGKLYVEHGDHQRALEQFRLLVEARPNSAGYRMLVGDVLVALGRAVEAVQPLTRATELAPNSFGAQFLLGHTLYRLGRAKDAVGPLHLAQLLATESETVGLLYAQALQGAGRVTQAIACLRDRLASSPESVPVREALVRLLETDTAYGEAIATLRAGMERDPQASIWALKLADLLTTCPDRSFRNRDEALQLVLRVCELQGHKEPTTLAQAAEIHAARNEHRQAAALLEEAIAAAEALGRRQEVQQLSERLLFLLSRTAQDVTPMVPDAGPMVPSSESEDAEP